MVVSTGVRYVVAPRGGGEDTHRAWEALYLGAVPIVKHSPIDSVFKDLPVHFVDECGTFGKSTCSCGLSCCSCCDASTTCATSHDCSCYY